MIVRCQNWENKLVYDKKTGGKFMILLDPSLKEDLMSGLSKDPHAILGMHYYGDVLVIRVYNPRSRMVVIRDIHTLECFNTDMIDERGLFECKLYGNKKEFAYELIHTTHDGHTYTVIDPYAFLPTISDYDLYLLNQGNHHKFYE